MPDSDETGQRRELLSWLDSVGLSPEAFSGVKAADLPTSVSQRALQPGPRWARDEVRAKVGLEEATFDAVCRAAGYRANHEFTEDDLHALHGLADAVGFFSDDELLHFMRVVSSAMARVADAATALFRIDIAPSLESGDAREVDWATQNYAAIQLIEPLLVAFRSFLLNELVVAADRNDAARNLLGDNAHASTLKLSVGFVDLVGYTTMSAEMNPDALGQFVSQFEARAHEVVNEHDGHVVKLIGDEVMFVNLTPTAACATALALIAAFDDEAATPSGGIATGEVVSRGGDYYGTTVNLAARIGSLAVTGEVLVDEATSQSVDTGPNPEFDFEVAGRRMLKGFADPVLLWSLSSR